MLETMERDPRPHQRPECRLTPFHVRGVEYETSAATGRRGYDVLRDQDVSTGFTRRQRPWRRALN